MKLNLARLQSIETTLKAIADIENAIEWYGDPLGGAVYLTVNPPHHGTNIDIQIKRQDFLDLMNTRKEQLIRNLEERFNGFEYDPDAHWTCDNGGKE